MLFAGRARREEKEIRRMEKNETREDMADVARQRSNIYGLLATIYREEVGKALLKQIRHARFQGALSHLGVQLGGEFLNLPEEKLIEDLAVEYARLFLGPGKHISPHESVHLTKEEGGGSLWGAATVKVKKCIECSGIEYKSDYRGMPDHISVELEFMQELTKREAQAWEDKDQDTVFWCLKTENRFIDEHILLWIPLFCEKVIKDAELSFYREVAKLTKRFLKFEQRELEKYPSFQHVTVNEFDSHSSQDIDMARPPLLNPY